MTCMDRRKLVTLTNLCMITKDDEILVIDRQKKDWPGFTFPGGHVEDDESIVDSVIREVKEETGLNIQNPKLCGVKDWVNSDGSRYIVFLYTCNTFTGGVGVSVVSTMWERREALHHTQLTEHINSLSSISNQSIQGMMANGLSKEQALAAINSTISQQGFIIGSNEIFLAGSIIFISMIPIIWLARPPFNGSNGGGH